MRDLGLVGGLQFGESHGLLGGKERELGLDLLHEFVRGFLCRAVFLLNALEEKVLAIFVVEETPNNVVAWLDQGQPFDQVVGVHIVELDSFGYNNG